MSTNLWLIPAVPLAASLADLESYRSAIGKPLPRLAIVGQVIALALSVAAFLPTLQAPGYRAVHNFTWFTFGEQALRIGWVLDPLAAAMLVMITFVGLCIFVFSIGYMARRQELHALLRLSLVFLRRDARRRHREQSAASLRLLGIGRARVLSADRILDSQTERGRRGEKSVHHHAHRRHRIFPRDSLALRQQRHTALLR